MVVSLLRHAGAGRHLGDGEEGMDTGFHRYDGRLMPIRRIDRTCACIFEGGTKDRKVSEAYDSDLRAPRAFVVQQMFL